MNQYREKNIVIQDIDKNGNIRNRLIPDAEFWYMGSKTIIRSHTNQGIERIRLGDSARILSLDEAIEEFESDPIIIMRARARIVFGEEDGGSNKPFTRKLKGWTIKRYG